MPEGMYERYAVRKKESQKERKESNKESKQEIN